MVADPADSRLQFHHVSVARVENGYLLVGMCSGVRYTYVMLTWPEVCEFLSTRVALELPPRMDLPSRGEMGGALESSRPSTLF